MADKTRITGSWKTVEFPEAFPDTPVVLPQLINLKADQALDVRVRNVSQEGFELLVQGEEKRPRGSNDQRELVHYIAFGMGSGEGSGAGQFEFAGSADPVTNVNSQVRFAQNFANADFIFLGHEQTTNGMDPGTVRYRDNSLNATGATIFFQEEKSRDAETAHAQENFGYAVFETSGNLVGTLLSAEEESEDNDAAVRTFEIRLYPNPADNNIVLSISEATGTEDAEIVIFNLFGQEVLKKLDSRLGDALDISTLLSGLYIVEVTFEGQTLRKLMIKN